MAGKTPPKNASPVSIAVVVLLVIAVSTQITVGYFSYRSMVEAASTAAWVSHTNEVLGQLERLHSHISETESARRGWLLTGDSNHYPYEKSLAWIEQDLSRLRHLTADNPEQQRNLDGLEPAVRAKARHMTIFVLAQGRQLATLRRGRELMAAVELHIDRMEAVENRLLARRQAEFDTDRESAIRMLLLGSFLGLALITGAIAALGAEGQRRRIAEGARRASEENYRSLVANIPDIAWTADAEGRVHFISDNVIDICGFSAGEVCAGGVEFWVERLRPEDRDTLQDRFRALFTDRRKYDFEYRFQRRDGQWIWLHARADAIHEQDGQIVTNGIISEITPRKVAEEQNAALRQALEDTNRELQRASQLKSQFLASMSHELRTPLNAIVGFSDLLSEETAGALNEKQRRFVQHVRTGAGHLLRLINDVLDISKIEAGQMELQLEDVDLQDVLPEVFSLVKPLAMQGSVRLEHQPVRAGVRADRVRLKQVLYNLLSNAIKFTPAGGVVRLACQQQGSFTGISVTDTGVGIRAEDQGVIFEEFRQVGESTKGIKEGTGLGLAITSRIVALHGGKIGVESEPGKGSCFTFTLPSAARGAPAPAAPQASPVSAIADCEGDGPLILVIDDEPSACELIRMFLAPEGYRLIVAHSAAEGMRLAKAHHPDLITLDILMPDGNGFGTLFELRADPDTAAIPIVVVSIVDQKQMGISFGAKDYLVKPIDRSALLHAVRKHIGACRQTPAILVVDDDAPTAWVIREELRKHGYSCHAVASGEEALHYLQTRPADLVLLDLMMPNMNGFEVLKALKASSRLSSIPVIVITAKHLSREEIAALQRAAASYVEKTGPWTDRLKSDVRRFLDRPAEIA